MIRTIIISRIWKVIFMEINHPKKIRGFTLLEIIIALFIFSIVSFIVVSALHNVLTTQSSAEKKADRLAQLQVALLFLSRDLEQTIHRPITNTSGNPEGFIGKDDMITFTHMGLDNPMNRLQRSTLQRTRYQRVNGNLQRLTWQVLDQTSESKPDTRNLLHDVSALHFDFLDNKNHFQKVWPPTDQPNAILPLAVRVTLTIKQWGSISQLYIIAGQPLEK